MIKEYFDRTAFSIPQPDGSNRWKEATNEKGRNLKAAFQNKQTDYQDFYGFWPWYKSGLKYILYISNLL